MTAQQAPRQWPTDAPAFAFGAYRLIPRAEYEIEAKLLSKRAYRRGPLTPLSPWDFALGWAEMSDAARSRHISFTQGDRFLFRHALLRGLSMERIEQITANVHLVPASQNIAAALDRVVTGSTLKLRGKLIDVVDSVAGTVTPTSLTRTDLGAGACEILFVESLSVGAGNGPHPVLPAPQGEQIANSLRSGAETAGLATGAP